MTAESHGPIYRVLGALQDEPKKSKNGYEARCPAHEDRHASLSIGTGLDGRVLLKCHKGCSAESILTALGLSVTDLFEHNDQGNVVRRFRLLDQKGKEVAVHVREDRPDGKAMWWESHGKNGLNGTAVESLPLYGLPDVLAADVTTPVVVCEGEKAAQALLDIGVLAVATATGSAIAPSEASLAPLRGHPIWLWPDNDESGQKHMREVAERLNVDVSWVDWQDAPKTGDAADYVAAGGDAHGIVLMLVQPKPTSGIKIWHGDELAKARFAPVRWAIRGILPSGLTILAGRPKLGKSWLALGWSLEIAGGTKVLKQIESEPGETLYLALEDNDRRMQERMAMMLGDTPAPYAFNVVTEWPRADEGGLDLIEKWLDTNPNARLVVIDTFKRFRPKETKGGQRLYDLDYDAISPVAALAIRRNVAIVVVFHTNKQDPADPIDLVSGTLGLSGAADGVLVLKRERGQADASLFVTGRDVEESDLALKWEKEDTFGWRLLGQADDFRRSKERQDILNVITSTPGMGPTEIAAALGKKPGTVRYMLFAMCRDGDLRNRDGKYFPAALDTTPNTPNALTPLAPANALTRDPLSLTPVSAVSGNRANRGVRGVSGHDTSVLDAKPMVCRVCENELWPHEEASGVHEDCQD